MNALNTQTTDFYNLITTKLSSWLAGLIDILPNLVVAVLIVVGFAFIARLAKKGLQKVLPRVSDSKSLNSLLSRMLHLAVILIGCFIALSVLNLDKAVTSLLAGAGIIGLALGFAFQDIAANFMSGVIMAVRKPIRPGDLIKTNDIFGTVQHVNLRSTEIINPEGQLLTVPNKLIFENPIMNYTITGNRRVDLECGVSYGDDLQKVKEVTTAAIESLDVIDKQKGVSLFFKEFGASSINYEVRFWLKEGTDQAIYLDGLSKGIMAIKTAYDNNGIDIPFPIRTLDFGIKGGEKLSEMMPVS